MNAIVDWVNTQHAAENWVLFTPAGVELSLGIPQDEALKVLRTMAAAGILRIEVYVYCPEGHSAWGGPVDRVPGYPDCQVCDFPSHDPDDYGLSEQFVWVDKPNDCTKCEATDGPGTGNPLPCALHPAKKVGVPDLLGTCLPSPPRRTSARIDIITCEHDVRPATNCVICFP